MSRVLVIDDEPMIRQVIAMVLDVSKRYSVETGATGADLAALLETHDDVVAIICDNQLVGETGLEIHEAITPIIRERKIAFFLLHGSGPALRGRYPPRHFEDRQIIELQKPMQSVLAIVGIIGAEVERLRA